MLDISTREAVSSFDPSKQHSLKVVEDWTTFTLYYIYRYKHSYCSPTYQQYFMFLGVDHLCSILFCRMFIELLGNHSVAIFYFFFILAKIERNEDKKTLVCIYTKPSFFRCTYFILVNYFSKPRCT